MSNSTLLYPQLMRYLRQHSQYRDLRHLKALAWMVSALIASGQLSLIAWEPYVPSFAQLAQSTERRWALVHAQRPDSSGSALSAPADGCPERVAIPSPLPGTRYYCPVGSRSA